MQRGLSFVLALNVIAMLAAEKHGWSPHDGPLLKYRVNLRFGEELVTPAGPMAVTAKEWDELRFSAATPDTMPQGWKLGRVSAVAVNAEGDVYVFHRGLSADPVMIFNAQGKYLRSWGRGMFEVPHGMRIDPAGNVWTTDAGKHLVRKFTPGGELLLTLGKSGQAGNTPETFNKPTDIAFARNGDFYVSDGYGNKRIVKFSAAGKYLLEFGKPGSGRGEFNVPHSVALDSSGNVYVSDRENNRIQIFTGDGKFLRQWTHLGSTQNLFMTPKDELWIITHRENVEATALNTLGGRIMHVDVNTGKILGVIESPGHWIHVTPDALIFVGSLTGNVLRWFPGWPKIA
jgi:DNA-binding beta-propeller fold protein YncE